MKRAFLSSIFVVLIAMLLAGCGGGDPPQDTPPVTGLKNRVLLSNLFSTTGADSVEIIDAALDVHTGKAINVFGGGSILALTPDKQFTVVLLPSSNLVGVVDNKTELVAGVSSPLPDWTESIVVGSDSRTAYAAVRNAGQVQVMDISTRAFAAPIAIARVRRLVMSPNGAKILAFSDDLDTIHVIDTATKTATQVGGAAVFDRPVWGVFGSDSSKAYILSCGPQCGGTSAKVTVLDIASGAATQSASVSAATIGLLDGGNLYVAGTAGGAGRLDVLNASTLAPVKTGVAISDGFHRLMSLGANNKLFVGARTCSARQCLSIYDTSAQAAVVTGDGDVTGLQPISGRSVIYVVQGGELVIYDATKSAPHTTQVNIVGQALDVKAID